MTSGGGWEFGRCSECQKRAKRVPDTDTWSHEGGDMCLNLLRATFIPDVIDITEKKEVHKQ